MGQDFSKFARINTGREQMGNRWGTHFDKMWNRFNPNNHKGFQTPGTDGTLKVPLYYIYLYIIVKIR